MTTKKVALLVMHGMGRTEPDYGREVSRRILKRLGTKGKRLHFGTIYYQGILQPNEDRVWNLVSERLRWKMLRQFVLFGLADAAGLETNKHMPDSVYAQTQVLIAKALFAACRSVGLAGDVVFLAHSLGGQVLSNYLWDAQNQKSKSEPSRMGIWPNLREFAPGICGGQKLEDREIDFIGGCRIRSLYTTGCNIPVFVAAHGADQVIPIKKTRSDFEWHNYYDKDDVLGWPLQELSPTYRELVTDHQVNAAGSVMGWLLKSWNPVSHVEYWDDNRVLSDLTSHLDSLL